MEIALMKRGELDSAAQLATEAFDDYVYMTNYLPEESFRYYCKRGYEMFDYREFSNDGKTMVSWNVVKKLM